MNRFADVHARLALGRSSSRALVDAALEHVAREGDGAPTNSAPAPDPWGLGAFIDVDDASARAQADRSDARRAAGRTLSPLDGIPIAIKDNILVEGAVCTAGSRILEGYRAPYDATVIAKLTAAGAVLFGRTSCDEFGMGSSTESCAWQRCANPWDRTRTPGGSSGGSAAAVSAGVVPLALGSDTGGSIRQPASMCGVVGLKPTYGRVSRYGLVAFASSFDVIGPLAADVEGAAVVLDVIAGPDARDATTSKLLMPSLVDAARNGRDAGVRGKTIGVPRALLDPALGLRDDVRAVLTSLEDTLREGGARIVDVVLPHVAQAVAAYYVLCTAEASSNLARFDGVRYGPRLPAPGGSIGDVYQQTRALFGDEVKRRIVLGSWVLSAGYYEAYTRRAQRVRRLVARDFEAAFSLCDAFMMPVSPEPAWSFGAKSDALSMYLADVFTVPPSLAGLPSISLPAGASTEGLPVGVQLVARPFDEAALVALASAVETVAPRAPSPPPRPMIPQTGAGAP
jgi:aspartyl-tRNA(Asn)/glutamyl-tRNA(Gln) amidotransferase subunit A